jgi:hypothetical protein
MRRASVNRTSDRSAIGAAFEPRIAVAVTVTVESRATVGVAIEPLAFRNGLHERRRLRRQRVRLYSRVHGK